MITAINLTKGGGSNATSFNTNSITPGANNLILLTISSNINNTGGTANDPTVSGASMTWVEVSTRQTQGFRITTFRALSGSPGTGALTIDFGGQTQHDINYSIDSFSYEDSSGTNGANAIVQSSNATASATTASITLSNFSSPSNVAFGGCMLAAGGVTLVKGSNFTELANENFNGSTVLETEYALNQKIVNWTWDGTTQTYLAIALEIKAYDQGIIVGEI